MGEKVSEYVPSEDIAPAVWAKFEELWAKDPDAVMAMLRQPDQPIGQQEAIADDLLERLPGVDLDTVWGIAGRAQRAGYRAPKRPAPGTGPRVISPARRRARGRERRPGGARRRSSARSGDSGDSDPPPPTAGWRWATPTSWSGWSL